VDGEPQLIIAAGLCRRFEGLFLKPYLCPANVATIGFGSTRYANGTRVTLSDPAITKQRAEELLMHELRSVQPRVLSLCPVLKDWGPGAIAAILDFAFNLGTGNLQSSTLRKKINANDPEAAKQELRKWVRGGGRVLPGLVSRRAAEAALLG
jgi:lysozyme